MPEAGKKHVPRLSKSHPDVHQKISGIVKAHVIQYDPVKLGQMSQAQKEAVNFALQQAVKDELPDDCVLSAAQVRDTLKQFWRQKLDQAAIYTSKHAQASGKRRDPDAQYADALKEEANGTLTELHPMFSKLEANRQV